MWTCGAGPGDLAAPLTIDIDSTIVASRAGEAGRSVRPVRGYPPHRTSADGEHTIVVIMVLTCGNAESA